MEENITNNSNDLQPWEDALTILATIIVEKHLANSRNHNSVINESGTDETGDLHCESSDRQSQ